MQLSTQFSVEEEKEYIFIYLIDHECTSNWLVYMRAKWGYNNGLMDLVVLLEDGAVPEEAHDGAPADAAVPDEMP